MGTDNTYTGVSPDIIAASLEWVNKNGMSPGHSGRMPHESRAELFACQAINLLLRGQTAEADRFIALAKVHAILNIADKTPTTKRKRVGCDTDLIWVWTLTGLAIAFMAFMLLLTVIP